MSSYPFMTIYAGSEIVSSVDYVDIDFTSASYKNAPIITASASDNSNVFVSNVTNTSARLNFSSTFTGTVSYIIREKTI